MEVPGGGQFVRELAAGFDEEGGGADRDVRDLEFEENLRARVAAEVVEDGLERLAHDRLGERARGVVGARPAAFVGRLENDRARRDRMRGGAAVDALVQRGEEVVGGGSGFKGLGCGLGELGVGLVGEGFLTVGGLAGEECVEVEVDRCAVGLLRFEGDAAAGGLLHLEAHDRLIDRADLLDIEGPVGEAFAVEVEEKIQDAVQGAVGDAGKLLREWCGGIRSAFKERKAFRIEEVSPAGRKRHRAVAAPTMHGAE